MALIEFPSYSIERQGIEDYHITCHGCDEAIVAASPRSAAHQMVTHSEWHAGELRVEQAAFEWAEAIDRHMLGRTLPLEGGEA